MDRTLKNFKWNTVDQYRNLAIMLEKQHNYTVLCWTQENNSLIEHQIVPESATTMLLGSNPHFELQKKSVLHKFYTSSTLETSSFIYTLRFVNLKQELGIYHLLPAMPLQPIFIGLKPELCHTIVSTYLQELVQESVLGVRKTTPLLCSMHLLRSQHFKTLLFV